MSTTTVPMIGFEDTARARRTDPSNGTRGQKRIDPLTRYEVAPDGCWLWQGFVQKNGYGYCWTGPAHRHFYRKFVGEIPAGMHVDHTCHDPESCDGGTRCLHRRCVNPDHLSVVTPRENVLRSNSLTARNASLTHCPSGHPYSGENVIHARGQRVCKACRTDQWRRNHDRNRARIATPGDLTPTERAILDALTEPMTDAEIAAQIGLRRKSVRVPRSALDRGGLIVQAGTKPVIPGTRPAVLWSLA